MGRFWGVGKLGFDGGRADLGTAAGLALEFDAVGVVPESIDGGGSQQAIVGESLVPLTEIQVAGHDGRDAFVTFGDQIVQVFIGGRPQRLETEIIDDEQRDASQRGELALVGAGGTSGVQCRGELRAAGEQHIDAAANSAMTKGLGKMTFADANLTDDEYWGVLGQIAVGGQVMDQGTVELRQSIEVELLKGLVAAKGGAAKPQGELLLVASRDFILDEHGEKIRVGKLGVDGFAITRLEGIEDAGEAQLLEQRAEFWNRVHRKKLL